MISGIYLLNFSNCAYYIGKSNNIERRWREHLTKFQKGTAAKAMQDAYDTYGEPSFKIHIECHEDHIDLLESICIQHNKHILINASQPTLVSPEDREILLNNKDLIELSTAQHIRLLNEFKEKLESKSRDAALLGYKKEAEFNRAIKAHVDSYNKDIGELTSAYNKLLDRDPFIVGLLEEIQQSKINIESLATNREFYRRRSEVLEKELISLKDRTLWQRIWNK